MDQSDDLPPLAVICDSLHWVIRQSLGFTSTWATWVEDWRHNAELKICTICQGQGLVCIKQPNPFVERDATRTSSANLGSKKQVVVMFLPKDRLPEEFQYPYVSILRKKKMTKIKQLQSFARHGWTGSVQ